MVVGVASQQFYGNFNRCSLPQRFPFCSPFSPLPTWS